MGGSSILAASRNEPSSGGQAPGGGRAPWQWQYEPYCPSEAWSPPVNVYHLEGEVVVCMELAGVDRSSIDVRVESGRLTIRGHRSAPDPRAAGDAPMRILRMEIDHGAFCRTIGLPSESDLAGVTSEYREGLLWVRAPLGG